MSLPAKNSRIPEVALGIKNGPRLTIKDPSSREYTELARAVRKNGKGTLASRITHTADLLKLNPSILCNLTVKL